jgi:hypothetical protein
MAPKHIFVRHHIYNFIVNVQPSVPTTAVCVRVEQVDRIVSAVCGIAVVIKHSMELIVHRF